MLVTLIVVFSLSGNPDLEVHRPIDAGGMTGCQVAAQPWITDWLRHHAGYALKRFACQIGNRAPGTPT